MPPPRGASTAEAARGDGTGKNNFVADGVVFVADHTPNKRSSTHDAADIHVVIEAVSEDGEDHDANEKLRVYAGLGIPHYWIIRGDADSEDIEGFVSMFELAGGDYRLAGQRLVSQLKGA